VKAFSDSVATAYCIVSYSRFNHQDGAFRCLSAGGASFAVITFTVGDDGEYLLTEYVPSHSPELDEQMILADLLEEAGSPDFFYQDLLDQEMTQVNDYLETIGEADTPVIHPAIQ
jgi:hypothetical protein